MVARHALTDTVCIRESTKDLLISLVLWTGFASENQKFSEAFCFLTVRVSGAIKATCI